MALYLDASGIVKLAVTELESGALEEYLRMQPERYSCALARTEVPRALRRHGLEPISRGRSLLTRLRLI